MNRVVFGLLAISACAWPQVYTISAKPGAVNFVEGSATLDGQPLTMGPNLKSTFMNAGGMLETKDGRVELLLTPGVFLRVGENSQVRMLKPSLFSTEIAIEAGESMLEVDRYSGDNSVTIGIHGALVSVRKEGLYRFNAADAGLVAVIDGKAEVSLGGKHAGLGKGREALLSAELKTRKFDRNAPDELYAWSNIRAQYNASLSYQAARSAYAGTLNASNGFYGPGWYWNGGFNSWLWMPGEGAFFSPFGWGFYGPSYIAYAPVVIVPGGGFAYGGRGGRHNGTGDHDGDGRRQHQQGTTTVVAGPGSTVGGNGMLPGNGVMTVPVNARHLPAVGVYVNSPGQYQSMRSRSEQNINANGGLRQAIPRAAETAGRVWRPQQGGGAASAGGGGGTAWHPQSNGGGGGHMGGGGAAPAPAPTRERPAGGGGGSHRVQ